MNVLTGYFRIGRDGELKYTKTGSPYLSLSLAYDHGKADDQGHRNSQWVSATLWGSRAEEIVERVKSGAKCWACLGDVFVRSYEKANGSAGFSLDARVEAIQVYAVKPRPAAQTYEQPDDVPF